MSTRMRRVVARIIGLVLLAALSLTISLTGFAQSDNTQVSGYVKDSSGAVVAGQHRPRRSAEVLLPIAAVAVGRSTCLGTVLELNSISLVSCMS